jgi:hypothetical protein
MAERFSDIEKPLVSNQPSAVSVSKSFRNSGKFRADRMTLQSMHFYALVPPESTGGWDGRWEICDCLQQSRFMTRSCRTCKNPWESSTGRNGF